MSDQTAQDMITDPQSTDINFPESRVLITGGLGFIGSNLASRLLNYRCEITLLDSLIPEYGGNLFNISGIEDSVQVNISDVRDEHSLKYLVQNQDFLFNLAGQTSHVDSMNNPFTDLDINSKAQLYILEACRKYNPDINIVFASTRQIYGRPEYLPVDEKHPLKPVDINGVNKLAGEWYHLLYHRVYGINTSVLRLTNTIGPRMRIKDARQTFLGIWIRRIIEGLEFEVWGGEQLRDFSYVDDAVSALLLAATNELAWGRVFNLGGAEVISLLDLARMLKEVNKQGDYVVKAFPLDRQKIDIGDFYADYSLISSILGWQPETKLRHALTNTLDFYRRYIHHYI